MVCEEMTNGGLGSQGERRQTALYSPWEIDQVFVLRALVTQEEPGGWDLSLLATGLYSLKWKPGQLDCGFQVGEAHPGKKLPEFTGNLKAFALACLDLWSEKLSDRYPCY